MDVELFKFLGTVALLFLVMAVLRRRMGGGTAAPREGAASGAWAQRQPEETRTPSNPSSSAAADAASSPARPTTADALQRVAAQAVLLRRHVPCKTDAVSYWGGVPLVPPGFEWPHFTPEGGSPRALSFIVQVDCAAIPAGARLGLMPDRGLIQVYMDLDWGVHWKWKVLHLDNDPATLAPAAIPESLPHAYGHREVWGWPQRDEDWPRILPRVTFDPVLITGPTPPPFGADDDDDRFVWPGSIDVKEALERLDGAIVDSRYIQNRYEDKILQRPYPAFPQDWRAVRIALGHLAQQSRRGHLDRMAGRPETAQQAEAMRGAVAEGLEAWGARANAADPGSPLDPSDRDAFWDFFVSVQPVSLFALRDAATQSLDATIAANPRPESVLDDEAMTFARNRHAFGSRGEHGLHLSVRNRMLSAPTDVQGDAAERAREWLMLLELSADEAIGHHFAEGVLQFYIRPEDLAARRFDRVDLYATAY